MLPRRLRGCWRPRSMAPRSALYRLYIGIADGMFIARVLAASIDGAVLDFAGFGDAAIRAAKISPDATLQMAVTTAYKSQHARHMMYY